MVSIDITLFFLFSNKIYSRQDIYIVSTFLISRMAGINGRHKLKTLCCIFHIPFLIYVFVGSWNDHI